VTYPWDSGDDLPWTSEPIESDQTLFFRVPRADLDPAHNSKKPKIGFFRERENVDGFSTNWCRYADARKTRDQVPVDKRPEDYAAFSFKVHEVHERFAYVRLVARIEHTPVDTGERKNRAHTDLKGDLRKGNPELIQLRNFLRDISNLEIEIEPAVSVAEPISSS